MLRAPWVSVSKSAPCPICGRADWCQMIPGKVAICRRTPSSTPKGDGFLHALNRDGRTLAAIEQQAHSLQAAPAAPRRNDLPLLAEKFRTALSDARLQRLAQILSVSAESLRMLDVGWSAGESMFSQKRGGSVPINAWSFPMRSCDRTVVGLRMRSIEGRKFSFTGGAGGLFLPRNLVGGAGARAYLCEGPSDTAAALDLGLNAFGRESCSASVDQIIAALKHYRFEELVIFSQRDEAKPVNKARPELGVFYPAQRGAETLALRARMYIERVRVILPPAGTGKDVRDWKKRGATAADVEQLVAEATPRVVKRGAEWSQR